MRRFVARLASAAGSLACATALGCGGDEEPVYGCPQPLEELITEAALLAHMDAWSEIAAAHGGTRAAGSGGDRASADYVESVLREAGYTVSRQEVTYEGFEVRDAEFAEVSPGPRDFVSEVDFRVGLFSASGDVTASVTGVDLTLGVDNVSTSGCEEEDFVGFPVGDVALIQRGSCAYRIKESNAAAAGASAVVIFNQGNTAERRGVIVPRLTSSATLPVLGIGYQLGVEFSQLTASGLSLRVMVDSAITVERTENVLAELPGSADAGVIMVGAHLDSVPEGPGINDNGSGSAAVLELGVQLAGCELREPVRLAFWGAEELGLLGSASYVKNLSESAIEAIALYVNLDMIASPNTARFLYDGDGSGFGEVGPAGSDELEAALGEAYAELGLMTLETPFDGRSDYGPFIAAGIPSGGVFTGAEGIKSEEQAAEYGGIAGAPYDPCYHQSCDDGSNYDKLELLMNTRAVGMVLESYALGERSIQGVSTSGSTGGSTGGP